MKNHPFTQLPAGSKPAFRLTRNFAIVAGIVFLAVLVFALHHDVLAQGLIVAAALGVIFLALLFMTWRAERLVHKQHLENIRMTRAIARAEAANNEKTQFLANISHELRTPLNAIIGFSEIIKNEIRGPLGNNAYREYVHDIHRSGEHLLNVINEVLDLVKAESGAMVVEKKPVDVVSLANLVVRMMHQQAEKAGVALSVEAESKITKINSDGGKLRHILINLISNGIKFTPAGGRVRVVVVQDKKDLETRIHVSDTGIGMKLEDIPLALSPFGQVENVFTKVRKGTGLGLSLCRKFVEMLGGRLDIDSVPDCGTTVTVSLPADLEHDSEDTDKEKHDRETVAA